jgi:tetratricopeptide (TPR) repeat protein
METNPSDALAAALAAVAYGQLGNYFSSDAPALERARAVNYSDLAGALDITDPLVASARASVAMFTWQPIEQVDALVRRALAMDPTNGWTWERMGFHLITLGDTIGAKQAFQRALRLKGASMPQANCLNGIGMACSRGGDVAGSVLAYEQALAVNPQAVWINGKLALAYRTLGDKTAAKRASEALRRGLPDMATGSYGTCLSELPATCATVLSELGLPT